MNGTNAVVPEFAHVELIGRNQALRLLVPVVLNRQEELVLGNHRRKNVAQHTLEEAEHGTRRTAPKARRERKPQQAFHLSTSPPQNGTTEALSYAG